MDKRDYYSIKVNLAEEQVQRWKRELKKRGMTAGLYVRVMILRDLERFSRETLPYEG